MSQAVEMSLARIDSPPRSVSPLGERFAATPRHACKALASALSRGDLEAALACFCPDACLVAPDGTNVHGQAAIRARLAQAIQSGAQVAIEPLGVIVAGEVALAQPTLVLRRLQGEWRIAIAAPWGWDPAPPLEAIGFTQ
jgi:ketosteroid isomerase-like protein